MSLGGLTGSAGSGKGDLDGEGWDGFLKGDRLEATLLVSLRRYLVFESRLRIL